MEDRIEELRAKRDLALELVRSIQDVHCPTPMGAFYIMPDVSELVGLVRVPLLPTGCYSLSPLALMLRLTLHPVRHCHPQRHFLSSAPTLYRVLIS